MKRVLAVWVVAMTGCVGQGTYDALQKDFNETKASMQAKLDQQAKDKADVDAALENERQISRACAEKAMALQAQLEQTQKAKADLEASHASTIKDKSRLQASVEDMKAALADLAKRKAEADARIAEFKGLLNRFRSLIDAGKLRVKMADGRMVVELASDVLFGSGSATLSKDGKASLAEVGGLLASIPDRKFQIEGHTDNVPIKSATYPSNWELAAARAITVAKTMVDAGMPAERISAASYGENKPAKPNDSTEGKAANRRIEIVVVPDLSSLPGFEELKRVAAQ